MELGLDKRHGLVLRLLRTVNQVQLQQVSRSISGLEPMLGPNGSQTAVCHNGNPVAQGIRFEHHVRGDDNCTLLRGKGIDQIPNRVSRGRIQPGRGFVQQEHRRCTNQGNGNAQTAAHTARQRSRPACVDVGSTQTHRLGDRKRNVGHTILGQSLQTAKELQVRFDGLPRPNTIKLGTISKSFKNAQLFRGNVVASNKGDTRC
mmetsp:Transcript_18071/g.39199  ORF Transcript_18071/g.39199 Transcript_18071/m.39199 type:complete len:203 (+) Transcript_18071:300-908(+)